ncbi:MAG TPA: ATP-binding protein [Vicinamibacterales bacterium]|jgi:PAS domain S-box-containing protein
MIPRVRAALCSPYLGDGVAALYAVAYLAWAAVHESGTPLNDFIADAAFYPLGLTVCWLALRNARAASRTGLGVRDSVAWRLLAASALTLWISGTAWANLVKLTGLTSTPGWIHGLEYLQLSLTIAACLTFPARRPVPRARVRFWLDVALMLVASGALAALYRSSVIAPVSNVEWLNLVIVRAALDWGVFFTLAVGVFHKRDRTIRVVAACLLAANICVLMANWLLTTLPSYRAGNPVDALWFSAWVLKAAAARYAWHRYRLGRGRDESDDDSEFRGAALPRAIVATAFVLLVYEVFTDPSGAIRVFVYAAAAMGTLLVSRQVAELRESRRLFEDQLALEARFRSLIQNSSDIVLVIGDEGRISYVSPSASHALGNGAIEVGSALRDLVPADDLAGLAPLLDGTLRDSNRLACRMRTATGGWRDIEMLSTDLRSDPAVGGFVLNGRDVTDRNDVERKLRHTQKLEAISHLAGGIAHDFNNALTAIRGSTELLLEEVPPTSSTAADLGNITEAVDRAAAVTGQLLAFSRRQAVQRKVLDFNMVLAGLGPLLRQLVTDRIEVRLQCSPSLWPIKADPGQLEQVIINLATNARDAMPRGGSLRITTTNRTITAPSLDIRGAEAGEYVSIIVSDDGVGMSETVRLRIFEPFFSTKSRDKGMGLGLAMVQRIVAQSDGHIAVESTEGQGTAFTILFPRTMDAPEVSADTPPPPGLVRARRRVLLVDDEPGVRTVVRRMLERAGYQVLDAAGGREALAILDAESTAVDLLLTDLVMPEMDGRQLIARFRERCPTTPIVCMTGFAGEPIGGDGADIATTVVTKPFSSDTLVRVVSEAVGP